MFISFEGGEGSGKTTAMREVANKLLQDGIDLKFTREPGGTDVSEAIRQTIINYDMDPITEALLFAAARREHVVKLIKPMVDEGKLVLCDRFIDSSYVYQGLARNVGYMNVSDINKRSVKIDDNLYLPDIVFYFDIDPEIGLERVANRNKSADRLDNENIGFHNKVRDGFKLMAQMNPRYITIDASKPLEEVVDEVYSIIKKKLEEKD